jgi:hypothetical protein
MMLKMRWAQALHPRHAALSMRTLAANASGATAGGIRRTSKCSPRLLVQCDFAPVHIAIIFAEAIEW